KICVAGAALGLSIGKIVVDRPHYLERLRPRLWLSIAKQMHLLDWLKLLSTAIVFAVGALLAVGWVSYLVERAGLPLYSPEEYIFARLERASPMGMLVTVNILPIFEEWVFRGVLLEEIGRRARSRMLGVLLSSIIFAVFHISNPGTYPAAIIPLAVGGVLLGICYMLGGLASAIVCHCAYNSLSFFWF
ncbi:MAG: CPBP family intramembrane metalloprotease, partial [Hadesarchaea archaeon]|nr:CPBP family intramembrane metalloprotease [Hadesarchaea archaeon]